MGSGKFRVETKLSDRIAGWLLLLPLVALLWAFTFGLAILFLTALAATAHRRSAVENLIVIAVVGIGIGSTSFLTWLLTGKLHDALSTYEFSESGVVKHSPFWRQEVEWSQVAVWALSGSNQTWWLLNFEGRTLISLDWYSLPSEKAEELKAFTCNQLLRYLPSAKWIQPSLWKRFWLVALAALFLTIGAIGGFLVYYFHHRASGLISLGSALILSVGILLGAKHLFRAPSRALFVVHGDWLSMPNYGASIHLPKVKSATLRPDGMLIVAEGERVFFVSKDFEQLLEYLKGRLPQKKLFLNPNWGFKR